MSIAPKERFYYSLVLRGAHFGRKSQTNLKIGVRSQESGESDFHRFVVSDNSWYLS